MPENRVHAAATCRIAVNSGRHRKTRELNGDSKTGNRLLIAGCLTFLLTSTVFARLGYLQLICHSEYLTKAQRQQQHVIEITPKRGAIYDRNMHPLAMSIPVDSAFAVPLELADQQLAARLLSGVLGIPRDVLEVRFESSHSFVWIARKLPPDKKEAVEALNLKGVYFQKENQRIYPKRDLASHVLGFVDLDEKGLGGIEYELDSQIRGKSEKIIVMADARQRWFDGGEAQRERGANVVLTLDEKIQYIAERELAAAIAKTHAMAGTVVVMNPNTGEILALANWPKFNPNAANESSAEARMNRAVTALYEPGSTFKLITLAAAFDQGITRPTEVFDCENGAVYVAGHRIHDHKPFGMLNVADILALSSDVGAIKIALRLGAPKFYDYIRAFGFGQPTGVDMPGESKGILRRLENWSAISIGSISMGQEVGVTPIQLISAVSAIANGGILYKPHIVAEVRRGDQLLPAEGPLASVEPRRVIRPETAATLRRLMEGVILKGTGPLARLDGWTAAGKTGSAQKIDPTTGRYSRTQLIASFTGFAPINNPAVTILVSLDSPVGQHEGGQVAAPVFKRIAEQVLPYLDVPRDVPIGPRLIQAAYRNRDVSDSSVYEDFTPADFSEQPDQPPAKSAATKSTEGHNSMTAVTVAVDEGGDIQMPDFSGKTMREVTEMCLKLGLDPVLIGSNLATNQTPAAGAKARRGAKVTVQFGTPAAKIAKPLQRARH
ncbi:MAG TPA: penicillin-binding transpeptidase domain-containing protein [Candidatus Acidoferrum sp.]|nr:penicillin-binding transpeptidase domain-containing protein [Candidatus Acidoferrum sp.]